MPEKKYPNRLKELRDARGLSQAQVATLSGFTTTTVNRHERGNRSLDGNAIDRYARLFDVSPFELFVDPSTVNPDDDPKADVRPMTADRMIVQRPTKELVEA